MRIRLLIPAAAALVAASVAAPALAGSGTGSMACPGNDRNQLVSSRAGAAQALVPGGATSVLLCRYNGLAEPGSPHAFELVASRRITSRSTVASLASQLNGLPAVPSGLHCPADFGNDIVAHFQYASGAEDPVTVDESGCDVASNGRRGRFAGRSDLVTRLQALVPLGHK